MNSQARLNRYEIEIRIYISLNEITQTATSLPVSLKQRDSIELSIVQIQK